MAVAWWSCCSEAVARRGGLALRPQELLQLRSAALLLGPAPAPVPAPAPASGEVCSRNIYNIYNI